MPRKYAVRVLDAILSPGIEKGPIAYLAGELSLGPSRGARKDEPVKRLRIFWQYVRVFTVGVWGWMRGPR